MQTQNLMEINSPNIGYMDTIAEYQRLYINQKVGEALKKFQPKYQTNHIIDTTVKDFQIFWKELEKYYNLYVKDEYKGYIIEDNYLLQLNWQYNNSNSNGINMLILCESSTIAQNILDKFKENLQDILIFEPMIEYLIYQYESTDKLTHTYYNQKSKVEFNPLAVPFIDDVDKFIDDYLKSDISLLILQGEPGTGKTTFIKYLLYKMQQQKQNDTTLDVRYSFDENIFGSNDFYSKIIFDDHDIFVLEDINNIIHKNSNEDYSNAINKFLSVTDGLVSKKQKIIISTNIESKTQLYPALIRPGRCYDMIKFRKLQGEEIDNLCDSCDKDLDLQIDSINASEFFAKYDDEQNSKLVNSKIGF